MAVGIDIGTHSIKAVELTKDGGRFRLVAAGIASASANMDSDQEEELVKIATSIKKLYKEAGLSQNQVVVSLPESKVFTRLVRLPALTDQEIASAIRWEAEQYIPIPLAEAIVQHFIVGRTTTGVGSAEVLLIAAHKKLVEKYVKVLNLAGLEPLSAETETLALVRALAPPNQTVFVVDFGAASTDIAIAKSGQLVFSRSIPTAGEALTRAVERGLSVSYTQAEEYKKTYGLSQRQLEGKVRATIDPLFKVVADELRKAVQFYQADQSGDAPKTVILSGGTSALLDAVPTLTQLVNMEVVIGDPFGPILKNEETAKKLAAYGPLYSIAVGLSMWEE